MSWSYLYKMSCKETSSNYILQQNMTLTWWLLPAQQVAALDFTTLSASRVGRQVRGSHDLDRSRMEEERNMYSSHRNQHFTSARLLWLDVFSVEAGWCDGTKHKETLFKCVQMRQLSQILYTSEWINPRQWETTMARLSLLRVNMQKCTVAPWFHVTLKDV